MLPEGHTADRVRPGPVDGTADGLVRELALVQARAVLDAVRVMAGGTRPARSAVDGPRLGDLLTRFRAGGGAVRFSVVGEGCRLAPTSESAVHRLMQEAMALATDDAAGSSLSVSSTGTANRLELLVVHALPPHEGRSRRASDVGGRFVDSRAAVVAAGGRLRVHLPTAGFVVAGSIPVDENATDGATSWVFEAADGPAHDRAGARIGP